MGLLDFITGNNSKKTKQQQVARAQQNYQQQRQVQIQRPQQQYAQPQMQQMPQQMQQNLPQPVNFDPNDPALAGLLPNLTLPKSEPAPLPIQNNNQIAQPAIPQPALPMPIEQNQNFSQPEPQQTDNNFQYVEPYDPTQVQLTDPVTSDPNSLMSEYEKADQSAEEQNVNSQNLNNTETLFGDGDLSALYPQQLNQPVPVQTELPQENNLTQNFNTTQSVQPQEHEEVTSMSQMSQGVDMSNTNNQFDLSSLDLSNLNLDNIVNPQSPVNQAEPDQLQQLEPQVQELPQDVTNSVPDNNVATVPEPATISNPDLSKVDFSNLNFDMDQITNSLSNINIPSADTATANPVDEVLNNTPQEVEPLNIQQDDFQTQQDLPIDNVQEVTLEPELTTQPEAPIVAPIMDMVPEANIQQEIITPLNSENYEMLDTRPTKKIFKRIGMLGLDINGIDDQISKIASDLNLYNTEILIDTRENSGEIVINTLGENSSRITGVYLKPMLSPTEDLNNENVIKSSIFSIVYSSYLEKLRHFIKESRLFIFFDNGSVDNISTLLTIWKISSMYKGNNKPIILYGISWDSKINLIKQLANDVDMNLVHIITDPAEVLSKIEELNVEYSNANLSMVERLIDRRVQGDEKDYVVY